MRVSEGKVVVSVKEAVGLAIVLVVLAFVFGTALVYAGRIKGWDVGYADGLEIGKGQIRDAMTGDIYELKLVGIKDGRAYELEGSYGLTINGQPDAKRIPSDARAGDSVACMRHEKGLEIVSRRQ